MSYGTSCSTAVRLTAGQLPLLVRGEASDDDGNSC